MRKVTIWEAPKVWDIKQPDLTLFGYHIAWIERQLQKQSKAWGKKINVVEIPSGLSPELMNAIKSIEGWVRPATQRCPVCHSNTTGCCDTSDYENER